MKAAAASGEPLYRNYQNPKKRMKIKGPFLFAKAGDGVLEDRPSRGELFSEGFVFGFKGGDNLQGVHERGGDVGDVGYRIIDFSHFLNALMIN